MNMYGRPPTGSLANRPSSRSGNAPSWGAGRGGGAPVAPGSRAGPPPAPPGNNRGPGTARPMTGSMRGGFGFQVADRPMTQQGLGGIKGNMPTGNGRMVQDRTFWQSELRQKIGLLTTEINKLSTEAETMNKENSNYAAFEKRADILANDLRELQGQLGDFNTLIDKLHTDSDLSDIEKQCAQLKSKNQRESQILDEIFMQRQQKDLLVREVEKNIEEERQRSESQINELEPERRALYLEAKDNNAHYLEEIQRRQIELDDLITKESTLKQEIRHDSGKQKALAYYEKLMNLQNKKEEMEESLRELDKEAGPQEKSRLLEQVKEDNQETSAMERKIAELEEHAHRLKEGLSQIDMDTDTGGAGSDKSGKYEELVKKDKEMTVFLDNFDDRKTDAVKRNQEIEKDIVQLLHRIKNLAKNDVSRLPSQQDHQELQSDLKFKEKEMRNSENTTEGLMIERDRRLQDLEKVNQLETKLNAELQFLNEKIEKLEVDIKKVSNIDAVKKEAEFMKKKNMNDREFLRTQRDTLKSYNKTLAARQEAKRAHIHENETYTQLGALEQRLRHHESNNFHLKDYIVSKTAESDYKTVAIESMQLVDELNSIRGKLLSLPPAR
ncbi:UNVERIFIED_CONTAM: Intraflagellar transport protein 74 [Siphonaria sp. JEL0065]|nr:Intraflagellar transport protein 74 [Siphonaria sp. JEL0065]